MPLESPFSSLHKAIPRNYTRFSRFNLYIVTVQVKKSKKSMATTVWAFIQKSLVYLPSQEEIPSCPTNDQ